MSQRILVVEDESELSAIIADYLMAAGYTAEVLADGLHALAAAQRCMPDLIVLDILLPGLDGIALCQALRAFSDVPIILVTAKVEEVDRLLGLETGADDYLCKPFSPRELVARVKAILRRPRTIADTLHGIAIDEATRTVRIHANPLDLTPTEYSLFTAMARHPGAIYSRAQLLDLVRSDNLDVNDRAIDTHIKNLRRKLALRLPDIAVIHSVYGLGYRVEFQHDPPSA